jgi:hypothetical protein
MAAEAQLRERLVHVFAQQRRPAAPRTHAAR